MIEPCTDRPGHKKMPKWDLTQADQAHLAHVKENMAASGRAPPAVPQVATSTTAKT